MRAWLVVALVSCGGGKGGGTTDGQMSGPLVGRVCDPGTVSPNETVLAAPALDCESQLCLSIASSTPPMCTTKCVDAGDCSEAAESACPSGFDCAPVVSVGPFACQKVCVCSDRVPFSSCP